MLTCNLYGLGYSTQKPGLVTIAGKHGDDLATGTLNSIYKQAGLKK
jgi:YcfA-like protein.